MTYPLYPMSERTLADADTMKHVLQQLCTTRRNYTEYALIDPVINFVVGEFAEKRGDVIVLALELLARLKWWQSNQSRGGNLPLSLVRSIARGIFAPLGPEALRIADNLTYLTWR